MQHSIIDIGERFEKISRIRRDDKLFSAKDFLAFAKKNKKKYSLIENGDDLLVNTWNSNDLLNDYKKTI